MLDNFFRLFVPFRGKQKIARFFFRNKIKTAADIVVNGKLDCKFLLPNIKENIGFEIFIDGIYEKQNLDFIINKLPIGSIMLDIGANIGSICIPICKLRPDVEIIAVEASARMYGYLEKNVDLNGIANLRTLHNAVSDQDEININFFSPEDKYGKGSMNSVFTDKSETVKSVTLDKIMSDVDYKKIGIIKVDVEGFEKSVFKGGMKILSQNDAPDIFFEFLDWAETSSGIYYSGEAQDFLMSMGYKLYTLKKNQPVALTEPIRSGFNMIYASKR